MRGFVLALAFALLSLVPVAAAEPVCVERRADGDCTLLLDPEDPTTLRYEVGQPAPPAGCDRDNDCCEGCWLAVIVCVPHTLTPHAHATGGVGIPTAQAWVAIHEQCTGVGCVETCSVYDYGYTYMPTAGVRDSNGDGQGDAIFVGA